MHRSRDATAYLKLVAAHYIDAEILTGPVSVNMVWHRGMKSGDLDKRIGVLLDALQGTVYVNDSQVVQLWARRCDEHPTIPKGHVLVEVSAT
jgi:Holliday junction resolvase RusA-like endonuclease